MALQVRITNPDGSNPVILDQAFDKSVSTVLSSADEGGSFSIARNAPKADIVNPYEDGYTKFWEMWDTETNERLNYGPISSIDDSIDAVWKVKGTGRSTFLSDFIKDVKTFYAPVDVIIDNLRFENLALQPQTSTVIRSATTNGDEDTVFGTTTINERYYSLSKSTKDNAIDSYAELKPGEIEPPNTSYTVDNFWTGMSKNDSIIIDLGDVYPVSKISLLFPWWGGHHTRHVSRTYDFTLAYADDVETPITALGNRDFGPFHEIYDSGTNNQLITDRPIYFYLGSTLENTGYEYPVRYIALGESGPINMRYIRVWIYNVHGWYGSSYDLSGPTDGWDYQCDVAYDGTTPGLPTPPLGQEINDRKLEPGNDCNASLVEIGVYKEIIPRGEVSNLVLQRIDSTSPQISYTMLPPPGDLITTTPLGYKKIETGGTFSDVILTWANANTDYNRFFDDDCLNCYQDAFKFAILDQNNSLIYGSTASSGSVSGRIGGLNNSVFLIKGSSDVDIQQINGWLAETDPFSYGASYAYNEYADSTAIIKFRGQSFRWYATIPEGKTGANVIINLESAGLDDEEWGTPIQIASFQLPTNVRGEVVYEITYESGILLPDTRYRLSIINVDGGYCSVDSFEGYWAASMVQYNEDSNRLKVEKPESIKQFYDGRFTGGSIYGWNAQNGVTFDFHGDRVVILSYLGYNHAKLRITIRNMDNGLMFDLSGADNVFIPTGDPSIGYKLFDLKGTDVVIPPADVRGIEIPQYVIFDSDDWFFGVLPDNPLLPWAHYLVGVYHLDVDAESTYDNDPLNFQTRCKYCTDSPTIGASPPTGQSYTVVTGDTLWGIAQRFYGAGNKYPIIYYANESVIISTAQAHGFTSNYAHWIFPGEVLWIPGVPAAQPPPVPADTRMWAFVDGVILHEDVGISVSFENETHLDIASSITEVTQTEYQVQESGLVTSPRIGQDTYEILREGQNTLVQYSIVNDIQHVASILFSSGADIDGLPLFTISQDKRNTETLGRTVMRKFDSRGLASYLQLIGLSRTELKKRRIPERRVTISHTAPRLDLEVGDSFILYTKKSDAMRLRIIRKEISESNNGRAYDLECITWPQII